MDDYDAICDLFRQADLHHLALLPAVFQAFSGPPRPRERFRHFVEDEDADVIVAEIEGRIVGFTNLEKAAHPSYPMFKHHEYVLMHNIVVDTHCRKQGVGSILMDATRRWARAHGLTFIQTTVWSANTTAKQFYAKHGFKTLSERIELPLDGEET